VITKHLISVCAAALMAGAALTITLSPARAGDNGPASFDATGLIAYEGGGGTGSFDGGGGIGVSTGLNNGAPPPQDGGGSGTGAYDGTGGGNISTGVNNGAPPPQDGSGSTGNVSTAGAPAPAPAIGTADGGGGNSPGI
jgi:hypothetical protein